MKIGTGIFEDTILSIGIVQKFTITLEQIEHVLFDVTFSGTSVAEGGARTILSSLSEKKAVVLYELETESCGSPFECLAIASVVSDANMNESKNILTLVAAYVFQGSFYDRLKLKLGNEWETSEIELCTSANGIQVKYNA